MPDKNHLAEPIVEGSLVRLSNNRQMGPGRVTAIGENQADIHFMWKGVNARVTLRTGGTERYVLPPGTEVKVRDPILSSNDTVARVVKLLEYNETGQTLVYRIAVEDGETNISEDYLEPVQGKADSPLSILRSMTWSKLGEFALRWRMRRQLSIWYECSAGIPALFGARIIPVAHQIYAARRILLSSEPRFLLADEVGLGKTIEAGLVIEALTSMNPEMSVLVIAPGSMSRQWLCELYLRFGARAYTHLDLARYLQNGFDQTSKMLRENDRIVVSATLLQQEPELAENLLHRFWDMVVVDEAHQYPPKSQFYQLLHSIARDSYGFLALSATPSKREIDGLTGLLALIKPDIYSPDDTEGLRQHLENQNQVWDLLSFTDRSLSAARTEGQPLNADDREFLAEEWENAFSGDTIVENLLSDLRSGDPNAAATLIAHVQEYHRLDHRIIRTRRATVQDPRREWAARTSQILEYQPDLAESVFIDHLSEMPDWSEEPECSTALRALYNSCGMQIPKAILTFLNRRFEALIGDQSQLVSDNTDWLGILLADPGPTDEPAIISEIIHSTPAMKSEESWLKAAIGLISEWLQESEQPARLTNAKKWIQSHLTEDTNNQVLVFAQNSFVVVEIEQYLSQHFGKGSVDAFHVDRSESELADVAQKFQRDPACRILVSDELGGEGRNFQNASAVVHFDTPWSVNRIEQRIGRLDRLGRSHSRPVLSLIMLGPSPIEQAILDIHRKVFAVFDQSIGGLEYILPRLQKEIGKSIASGSETLNLAQIKIASEVDTELSEVDEAFDLALDASRPQLEYAQEISDLLSEDVDDRETAKVIAGWARILGIGTKPLKDRSWEFKWDIDQLVRPLPSLPDAGAFFSGCFRRDQALKDEQFNFFAPGHRLINAITDDFDRAPEGRATMARWDLGRNGRGHLYLVVLARCQIDRDSWYEQGVPPHLFTQALSVSWPEIVPQAIELKPGEYPAFKPVTDTTIQVRLHDVEALRDAKHMDPDEFGGEDDLSRIWDSVEEAIPAAIELIQNERQPLAEDATNEMRNLLASEMGYLHWRLRQSKGEVARSIKEEIQARNTVIESLGAEQIDADAVLLVYGL
jgi:ATP-dependent helicase HepA